MATTRSKTGSLKAKKFNNDFFEFFDPDHDDDDADNDARPVALVDGLQENVSSGLLDLEEEMEPYKLADEQDFGNFEWDDHEEAEQLEREARPTGSSIFRKNYHHQQFLSDCSSRSFEDILEDEEGTCSSSKVKKPKLLSKLGHRASVTGSRRNRQCKAREIEQSQIYFKDIKRMDVSKLIKQTSVRPLSLDEDDNIEIDEYQSGSTPIPKPVGQAHRSNKKATEGTYEYPPEIKIFGNKCVTEFKDAAATLLYNEELADSIVCTEVPQKAPLGTTQVSFLIDTWALEETKSLYRDSHGAWGRDWKTVAYYKIDSMNKSIVRVDCSNKRERRNPPVYDAKLIKIRMRHQNTDNKLIKHIFTVRDKEGRLERYALIGYKWDESTEPFEFEPGVGLSDDFETEDSASTSNMTSTVGHVDAARSVPQVEDAATTGVEDCYGVGVNVYSGKAIVDFPKAAAIITEQELPGRKICRVVPKGAPLKRKEVTFVVDLTSLSDPSEVNNDEMGFWGKNNGDRAYYKFHDGGVKKAAGGASGNNFDVKCLKERYRHPNSDHCLMKHVYTAKDRNGTWFRYAMISYKWFCEPFALSPAKAPPKPLLGISTNHSGWSVPRHLSPEENHAVLQRLRGEFYDTSNMQWSVMNEDYLRGLQPFGSKFIEDFKDAVDILLGLDSAKVPLCPSHPPGAPVNRREITFVIDLKALDAPEFVFADPNGSWGKSQEDSLYFSVGEELIEELGRTGNVQFNAKITRSKYKHPNTDSKLKKYIFTCRNPTGKLLRRAIVSYQWEVEPFPFKPGPPIRNLVTVSDYATLNNPEESQRDETSSQEYEERDKGVLESMDGEETATFNFSEGNPISASNTPKTATTEDNSIVEEIDGVIATEKLDERHSNVIHPEEIFPDGVVPFSAKVVNSMAEAADLLLRKDPPGPVCDISPLTAPLKMKKVTYIVDLQALDDPKDIFVDLHGVWGLCSGQNGFYRYTTRGVAKVDANGKIKAGEIYDVKMTKHRYLHQVVARKLRKYVFVAQNTDGDYLRWGLVSYQWHCEPFTFKPAAHGNCTKNFRPFQPTKKSVRNRIKELSMFYAPEQAVAEYLNEKREKADTVAPHELPRDTKQASNSGRFPRSIHRAAAIICKNANTLIRAFPSNENVFSVMDETLGRASVCSYTVTKHGWGDYSCMCEEYKTCCICRHSLAIARMTNEAKEFIENIASRMRDWPIKEEILFGPDEFGEPETQRIALPIEIFPAHEGMIKDETVSSQEKTGQRWKRRKYIES